MTTKRFFHVDLKESDLTVASEFNVDSFFDWSQSGVDDLLYNNQNIGTEWWIILRYSSSEYPSDSEKRICIEFINEGSDKHALLDQLETRSHERKQSIEFSTESEFLLYYSYSNGANLVFISLHQHEAIKVAINELDIMMMLRVCILYLKARAEL